MKIKIHTTPGTVKHAAESVFAHLEHNQLRKEIDQRLDDLFADPHLMEQGAYEIAGMAFDSGFRFAIEKMYEMIKHNTFVLARIDGKEIRITWETKK